MDICGTTKHREMTSFKDLGLKEPIAKALTDLGYENLL